MKTLIFTGGHHTSALAVAVRLRELGYEIIWLGHRHSMHRDKNDSGEYKDVTAAGIAFIDFRAGKFYRTFHPKKLLRLPLGFWNAYRLITQLQKTHHIAGIVSFGGYLAVPVVVAGYLKHIPSITHEQTVESGWANKAISIFASKIAISWPNSLKHFPAKKTVLTGLPLRPEIIQLLAKKTRPHNRKVLYITGGKQGSHAINECVFSLLPELTKSFTVIHQTGTSSLFNDNAKASSLTGDHYQPFGYGSDEAISALEVADVVISRSGAHICYELSVLQKKSVLIPLPWSSHQEQLRNAEYLESQGCAVLLPQEKLTPESLLAAIHLALLLEPQPSSLPQDGLDQMVQLVQSQFK